MPHGATGRLSGRPECAGEPTSSSYFEPDHVPWGHLNLVDRARGGYGTMPACPPLRGSPGRVVRGDGWPDDLTAPGRTSVAVEPYEFPTDTVFPCMAVTDLDAAVGHSGAAVLSDGRPAGIASLPQFGAELHAPLAEGLTDLLG